MQNTASERLVLRARTGSRRPIGDFRVKRELDVVADWTKSEDSGLEI
jgi:hypothetical protein